MKYYMSIIAVLFLVVLFTSVDLHAQVASGSSYTLEQTVIAGGGGTSAAGTGYRIDGTIGQPLAGATSTNIPFTVQSGFWTAAALVPTASTVTVTGRVLTPDGHGLTNARVTLTDTNGGVRTALTGGFGYFSFTEVESGQMYVFSVVSKRFEFVPQALMVMQDISDLNFSATMLRTR